MNKEKLKLLPFNLFWCLSSFLLPLYILNVIININVLGSIGVSFYIYFLDVISQVNNDYLSDRIKKLEDGNNE